MRLPWPAMEGDQIMLKSRFIALCTVVRKHFGLV